MGIVGRGALVGQRLPLLPKGEWCSEVGRWHCTVKGAPSRFAADHFAKAGAWKRGRLWWSTLRSMPTQSFSLLLSRDLFSLEAVFFGTCFLLDLFSLGLMFFWDLFSFGRVSFGTMLMLSRLRLDIYNVYYYNSTSILLTTTLMDPDATNV
jgi:hypothetical protein